MSEYVMVRRALAGEILNILQLDEWKQSEELRAVLAQEVGKCEPVKTPEMPFKMLPLEEDGWFQCVNAYEARYPLYTSPPAPVSVNERVEFEMEFDSCNLDRNEKEEYENPFVQSSWEGWQARACLDKVKELNQ